MRGLGFEKIWNYGPRLIQGGICVPALNAMYPYVNAMKYGDPYILKGKDTYEVCYPDPKNPVIFELSRVKMEGDRPPFKWIVVRVIYRRSSVFV